MIAPAPRVAALLQPNYPDKRSCDLADVAAAREHGVAPLLYAALRAARGGATAPPEVMSALARTAREDALLEQLQRADLRSVVRALAGAGVPALLFKGSALAYSVYDEPWHRPRADTDLLVRREDVERVRRVLEAIGYARLPRPSGEFVTHQFTWAGRRDGVEVLYDVHWKISDPQVFAGVLQFGELAERSVAIPALGPEARRIGDADALIVACVHRVAHHYDEPTLIRVCDIDRLARRLSDEDWDLVADTAAARRVRAVCRRGLEIAGALFETPVPSSVLDALNAAAREPSARYLKPALRKIDILRSDLEALPGWRARALLLREHLFPPADFVTASAAPAPSKWLPLLYLKRILRGAAGWFEPLR